MKRILPLLGLLFAALICSATENPGAEPERPTRGAKLVLRNGDELLDWRLMSETATTVTFRHKGGAKKIAKKDLPAALAKFYPVDHSEAAQEAEAAAAEKAAYNEQKAATAAKIEAEGKARAAATEKRRAELAAERAAREQAKRDLISERQVLNEVAAETGDDIVSAIRARAEDHYKDGRRNGSGQTLVFDLRITLEPVVEKPGWPGRYTCTGTVAYSLYDSVWGGSFTSRTGSFSCEVQRGAPGYAKVTEFRER